MLLKKLKPLLMLSLILVLVISFSSLTAADEVLLNFYYPVGVAGPLAEVVSGMVEDFNEEHPDITVQPVYAGNYDDTMQKVQTAVMGGNPPDIAVVEISEFHSLKAMDATIPVQKYLDEEDSDFLDKYFDAFLANGNHEGVQYTIPFQRSTPVFYWNKEHFQEKSEELKKAGLDPERAPETWEELVEYGKVLTDKEVNRWGVIIPGGWNDWILEAFARQNNTQLMDDLGTEVNFTDEKVLEAVQLWYDMSQEYEIMPPQVRTWSGSPADFVGEACSMLYNSTGALTYIKESADFDFGVAFMPKNETYGAAVGGGDFHIFKNIPEENQDAAWEFIKFMTNPENAAYWSRKSGYIAVREDAFEEPEMKDYVEEVPEMLVARNQLDYAYPKMSSVNYQRIREILTSYLDQVIEGDLEPREAMESAQREATSVLPN